MKRTSISRTATMKRGKRRTLPEWHRRAAWQALRVAVYAREDGRCACCGLRLDPNHWECHHRRLKSQGGRDELENLVGLTPACHAYWHGNRDEARDAGFVIHHGTGPAFVPIAHHARGLVWLTPEGYSEEAP